MRSGGRGGADEGKPGCQGEVAHSHKALVLQGSMTVICMYVYMLIFIVMHSTCMCRRIHEVHVSMCVWLCQMYMDIICAYAYVYVCV